MSAVPPQAEMAEGATGEALRRTTTRRCESVRSWLVVYPTGQSQAVEAGKHAIMRRTGLPGRDLRILDPVLSYPSAVLGRERAIVVNLEHIKAIITAEEVMFLNADHPLVKPFIDKLRGIFRHRQAAKEAPQVAGGDVNNEERRMYNLGELPTMPENQPQNSTGDLMNKNEEGSAERAQQVAEKEHGLKTLPFEFVALEACLEVACTALDVEASRLEEEAHPLIDKLTTKISTLSLDGVREIKRRLVEIIGRVQQVRDQLEHLLDDDEDMAEMYLTEKLEEQLENSCVSSAHEQENLTDEVPSDAEHRLPVETTQGDRNSAASDNDIQEWENHPTVEPNSLGIASQRTHSTHMYTNTTKNLDVKELEMILEAYFVQIDGTLHKLSYLREYVDDTEDYINIMLDDKQNHLLQMGVMLSTATVVVSAFVAMTGVFGMNITIELFDPAKAGMYEFLWTVGGGTIASFAIYVAAFVWARKIGLLE